MALDPAHTADVPVIVPAAPGKPLTVTGRTVGLGGGQPNELVYVAVIDCAPAVFQVT